MIHFSSFRFVSSSSSIDTTIAMFCSILSCQGQPGRRKEDLFIVISVRVIIRWIPPKKVKRHQPPLRIFFFIELDDRGQDFHQMNVYRMCFGLFFEEEQQQEEKYIQPR